MKNILLTFTALAATAQVASAAVISVNLADQNNAGSVLADDESAGAVDVGFWNNFVEGSSAITVRDDSDVTLTGTTFNYSGTIFREAIFSNNNKELLANVGNTDGTFTVAGLPTAYTSGGYNVYLYVANDSRQGADYTATITPAGGSAITIFGEQRNPAYINAADGTALINSTGATAMDTTGGDYVLFTGLDATGFTLTSSYGGGANGQAGIQIVAVPEPSAALLGALGLLGLLHRRR